MATIWIIERPGSSNYFERLIGSYAVRVFASLKSFKKIIKLNPSLNHPSVLLVDEDSLELKESSVYDYLCESLNGVELLLLSSKPKKKHAFPNVYCKQSNLNSLFDIISIITNKTNTNTGNNIISYKNIEFDKNHLRFKILPDVEWYDLSPKESKLLYTFIANPTVCLSKDDLNIIVWNKVKVSPRTIDSLVSRLRKKIINSEAAIESKYGDGYIFS